MTINLKGIREWASLYKKLNDLIQLNPATVIALLDRLEAAEKDAARYRWMIENHKLWSWQPTRYNADVTSGFAFNGTGYLGYSIEDALALAMGEQK